MFQFRYYIPLYQFHMDRDELELDEFTKIRKINDGEIQQFKQLQESWDQLTHDGFIIEHYLQKESPEDTPHQYDRDARKILEEVVAKLRLFKEGIFGFSVLIHPYTEDSLAMAAKHLSHYKTWISSVYPTDIMVYQLSDKECDDFYKFYQTLIAGDSSKFSLAISYYNKSYIEPYTPRDSLLDIMICLENLYLRGLNGELLFRLRLNASWLIGQDVGEREEIYDKVGNGYKIRSQIVHGLTEPYVDILLFLWLRELARKSLVKFISKPSLLDLLPKIAIGKGEKS